MGQTQSQSHSQVKHPDITKLYSDYIQQQQNLIFQQQQQINSLYNHNLRQGSNPPPMFQNQQTSMFQNQPPPMFQDHTRNVPKLNAPPRQPPEKLDPYKILSISKTYDKKTLKRAYLKAAMRSHPDRGGSPLLFQKVSIAYTILAKKLNEADSCHSHNELRHSSNDYMKMQGAQPKVHVKMTENFDVEVFNKIYEENKIAGEYDRGYGSWMEQNSASGPSQKLFQNGFNKDMFNSTFEKYKQDHSQKYSQQLVEYRDPAERISLKNQDSLVTLGQGKISDFSGSSDNLQFTDYKKAFTDGSMMINPSSVSLDGRATSMDGIKHQRSNLSYRLSEQDHRRLAIQQQNEYKLEEERRKRVQNHDKQHGRAYEKVHKLLLR